MLELKGADNKDWKKLEKKPVHRKTISTSIEKNTNKRINKNLLKDARRLQRQARGETGQPQRGESDGDSVVFGDSEDEGAVPIEEFLAPQKRARKQ